MYEQIFVDTNVLLNPKFNFSDYERVYISIISIEELDGLKKSEQIGHLARKATDSIIQATNKEICSKFNHAVLAIEYLEHKNDNHILAFAYDVHTTNDNCVFLTDDYNLFLKAESIGLPCDLFEYKQEDPYTGYRELHENTEFINNLFDELSAGINSQGFLNNEYLLLHNTDTNQENEYRFDGKQLVGLRLPPSKIIKGKNFQQRFALDLLNNKNIPVKIIAGGFGSGKTMLSVKLGLNQVIDKEIYKTLVFIRNPIVADGTDIGFLKGDKSEKIADYCRPFLQYIEPPENYSYKKSKNKDDEFYTEDTYAESLVRQERIKMDVVSFLKGVSIDDSFVIMDEAEDLNTKLIKLVGSRIGESSCIVFTGDWKQSENKYKNDNGLLKLIRESKGNPLVGIVVLNEDLRSKASKIFADLT